VKDAPRAYAKGLYGLVDGAVNVYIIDDAAGVTVIDAGLPGTAKRIIGLLRDIGRAPRDVTHILVTHADVDHVGDLRRLADATGARVYAGTEALPFLRSRRSPPHVAFPISIPVALVNLFFRRAVIAMDALGDGETINAAGNIRAISTPGHTQDHVAYYWEREKTLFAGDALENKDGLGLFPRNAWNRALVAKSAIRVLSLNPAIICPGHGAVWFADKDPHRIHRLTGELSAIAGA
jgi:glyoxylase-like metal-dependent hydrolase (beta-lactamase superfamily II)